MESNHKSDRYRREGETLIVELGVKDSRQLFSERDPAPFRERDLDPQFVEYLVSSVEDFPVNSKMKIRIISANAADLSPERTREIGEAVRAYFHYETILSLGKLRKRYRTARYFFLIGLGTLVVCLSLASAVDSLTEFPRIRNIASVGLVIIGWVAMWHPIEALLYGWWPIREQRQYFNKIAHLEVEVRGSEPNA